MSPIVYYSAAYERHSDFFKRLHIFSPQVLKKSCARQILLIFIFPNLAPRANWHGLTTKFRNGLTTKFPKFLRRLAKRFLWKICAINSPTSPPEKSPRCSPTKKDICRLATTSAFTCTNVLRFVGDVRTQSRTQSAGAARSHFWEIFFCRIYKVQ